METKERIRKIIENEGLSQADFSRMTGINTSTLSHVLTGRNNPSIEVINKILTAFPKYNSQWLVNGEGEPTKNIQESGNQGSETADNQHKSAHYPLFGEDHEDTPTQYTSSHSATENQRLIQGINTYPPSYQSHDPVVAPKVCPEVIQLPPQKVKVDRIIVYYEDDTFECFIPEKK